MKTDESNKGPGLTNEAFERVYTMFRGGEDEPLRITITLSTRAAILMAIHDITPEDIK